MIVSSHPFVLNKNISEQLFNVKTKKAQKRTFFIEKNGHKPIFAQEETACADGCCLLGIDDGLCSAAVDTVRHV